MGADVSMAGRNVDQLRHASARFGPRLRTVLSTRQSVETLCHRADLVICAVLVPGAAAPKLISAETVKAMKPGAVIVDVSIDQGGAAETSRPTTHSKPTYVVDGVVHYCVTNMPGAVARTSTFALNNVTAPYVIELAEKGCVRALLENENLREGLNVHAGAVTHKAVADALGLPFVPAEKALKIEAMEK
jgi:alanine dehydrogenase